MNLTQLRAFREVMKSSSLSQAARRLGRTQPAVSLAIKALEDDLGLKLFEREGRQMVPVPEAHYLLGEADQILERVAAVGQTMSGLINAQAGHLNVAAMPGPSVYLFPRFISQALGDNPSIKVSIRTGASLQIRELVATQSIDFGFADTLSDTTPSQQIRQQIIAADCFCALPREHHLASKTVVAPADLKGQPLGALQGSHFMRERLLRTVQEAGLGSELLVDCQYFMPLLPFVSEGRCLTIVDPLTVVSEQAMNTAQGKVVFRPMPEFLSYEYAIFSPLYRPLSQLAAKVREGWHGEVLQLLEDVGARPRSLEEPLP